MKIAIEGTKSFNDYSIFLRAMGTALSLKKEEDREITIFSCGPVNISEMGLEFSNVSERSLKARNIKIKFIKVPSTWIKKNLKDVDYFAFFSKPKESVSELVDLADKQNIEVVVYRY